MGPPQRLEWRFHPVHSDWHHQEVFKVTANEMRCSEDMVRQFQLFRVFDFARQPRVYILTGSLRAVCRLEPILFRATI